MSFSYAADSCTSLLSYLHHPGSLWAIVSKNQLPTPFGVSVGTCNQDSAVVTIWSLYYRHLYPRLVLATTDSSLLHLLSPHNSSGHQPLQCCGREKTVFPSRPFLCPTKTFPLTLPFLLFLVLPNFLPFSFALLTLQLTFKFFP